MRSLPFFSVFVLVYLHTDVCANEDSFTFIPSIAYQDKRLSFDQRYEGNANNEAEFAVHLPVVNLSFTSVYKKTFVALKFEKSVSDVSTTTSETDRSQLGQPNLIALDGSDVDVGRRDMTVTMGYNFWESMNLFIGYLSGKTNLTPNPFCANPFSTLRCSRTNRAYQQFFIGDEESLPDRFIADQPIYMQEYTESGPYVGVSYSKSVRDYGTLSFSIAYADMDGEYEDNANDPGNVLADPDSGAATFVAFKYKGSTTGTSLGVSWISPLSDSSAYVIDIRRQSYSMTGADATGLQNFEGVSFRMDEIMLGVSAGLQYYF